MSRTDTNGFTAYIRKNWQPVLDYDSDADVELLQALVLESFAEEACDRSWEARFSGAENSIRTEKLVATDADFEVELAKALVGLDPVA